MSSRPSPIELLAPAKDVEIAMKAILCGADAVYIGASSHGARAAAGNSVADIGRLVEFAHGFGVKIYVTVNTLVYDKEIPVVENLIRELYSIGTDALIVQDMGILRMDIPPIDLHASTQCDIRTAGKARFLADAGFSRVVLARELSLDEIRTIHREVDVELETFIHGALCVSYSGDCRASYATTKRSANRGECAQICRLKYDLTDSNGHKLAPPAHYLSLRDLNRFNDLESLVTAGVTSLKIEGRLKDESYVMNAVAAYSRKLDDIVSRSDGRYIRSSWGKSDAGFTPSLEKGFNRGFTSYFFTTPTHKSRMASLQTPKMTGLPIATVSGMVKGGIRIKSNEPIANGDGLGFFTPDGVFTGFRVNRSDGNLIIPTSTVNVRPGTQLYRNRDKAFDDRIASARPERTIDIDLTLSLTPAGILSLTAIDTAGHSATATIMLTATDKARTPQSEARHKVLSKLGDTHFSLRHFTDNAGQIFIPASLLTALRRDTIAALLSTTASTYHFRYRKQEHSGAELPSDTITMHDNVANRLAAKFYADHGALSIAPALETATSPSGDIHVMTTRYCLRRELGACLMSSEGKRYPSPLFLRSPGIDLRLDFDCRNCQMNIYLTDKH